MITHRRRQRTVWVVCAATVLAALSACAPAPGTLPSPSVSPTPTFASEEEAFAAAEKVYRAYVEVINSVDVSDPRTFEALRTLSSGGFRAAESERLSELHAEGFSIEGTMSVSSFEGAGISADYREVVAFTCLDVSEFDVVSPSGESVVAPDRPDVTPLRVEFHDRGGALVIDSADQTEEHICAQD